MTRKIKLGWSDKATDNFFYKGHSIYWNKGRTYIICPSGERYYVSSELSLEKVRESIDGIWLGNGSVCWQKAGRFEA